MLHQLSVFPRYVLSWVPAEGSMDVFKGESIPIGLLGVDQSLPRNYFD